MAVGADEPARMDIVDISWHRVGVAIAMFLVLGLVWMTLYFAFVPAPQEAFAGSLGWDAGFLVAFFYMLIPTYQARRRAMAQTK